MNDAEDADSRKALSLAAEPESQKAEGERNTEKEEIKVSYGRKKWQKTTLGGQQRGGSEGLRSADETEQVSASASASADGVGKRQEARTGARAGGRQHRRQEQGKEGGKVEGKGGLRAGQTTPGASAGAQNN